MDRLINGLLKEREINIFGGEWEPLELWCEMKEGRHIRALFGAKSQNFERCDQTCVHFGRADEASHMLRLKGAKPKWCQNALFAPIWPDSEFILTSFQDQYLMATEWPDG